MTNARPSHWWFTAIGHRCCSQPGADYRRNTGPGDAEGSLERPRVRTGLGGRPRRGQRRCPPGGQRRQDTVAVAVFVVLGSLTVAGPVVFYMVAATKAEGPLGTIKEFMSDHNAVIMFVLLLVLGAKLLGDGIAGLSS